MKSLILAIFFVSVGALAQDLSCSGEMGLCQPMGDNDYSCSNGILCQPMGEGDLSCSDGILCQPMDEGGFSCSNGILCQPMGFDQPANDRR